MAISTYETVKNIGIPRSKIKKVAEGTLKEIDKDGMDLSVHFVGSASIRKLNKKYRKKDKATDVLSFAVIDGFKMQENSDLGDIFICVPFVRKQAKAQGIPYKQELLRVFIHGILHLAGYDHVAKAEEKIMFSLQEKILEKSL